MSGGKNEFHLLISQVEEFFNFDPAVGSQAWTSETEDSHTDKDWIEKGGKQKQEDLRKLCNHRREVLALAAFHNSQSQMSTGESESRNLFFQSLL